MVKRCKKCQQFYEAITENQVYCSPKCRASAKYYVPRPIVKKVCDECGKEFRTRISFQRFCGKDCREEYYSIKKYKWKICISCGQRFETSTSKKKYCSKKCYIKEKNLRENKRYKEKNDGIHS